MTGGRMLAVDIGGTFVDAVEFDRLSGEIRVQKMSTTPDAPARGVVAAVRALGADLSDVATFGHGTTLGLNAILQRRGADVGIVTNEGFRDRLEIARAAIPPENTCTTSPTRRRHRSRPAGARVGVAGAWTQLAARSCRWTEQALREAGRVTR